MRRKVMIGGIVLCLLLGGCSGAKVPELLDPVGETMDSAKVTRGEMYNIRSYDLAVTSEYKEVKLAEDGIIQNMNVEVGDEVKEGDVLVTMDTESVGEQLADIDEKIARKEAENAYMNEIEEYELQILQDELQILIDNGGNNVYQVQDKNKEITEKKGSMEKKKVEQQKEIAELQMAKTDGANQNGAVVAPWDGTITYLYSGANGSVTEAGTVVAIVAKKDSKILFGEYIDRNEVRNAHKIYAVIGGKEYNVTNVPYDQIVLNNRLFRKLPIYSTFYIEEAPEVTLGMYAAVVVITDYMEDAIQIPENALLSDEEGTYVYKKKGEEFERQNVKTGHTTATSVEITEGLKEGDEVYVKP